MRKLLADSDGGPKVSLKLGGMLADEAAVMKSLEVCAEKQMDRLGSGTVAGGASGAALMKNGAESDLLKSPEEAFVAAVVMVGYMAAMG